MLSSYHIIPLMGAYYKRNVLCYQGGRDHRHQSHVEEFAPTFCEREVVQGRDNFCSLSIVNPKWNYNWCHVCVQALPWTDEAKELWRTKGIEVA